MDQSSFDRLTRLLSGGATRRTGVRALLGAMIGVPVAAAAIPGTEDEVAARGDRKRVDGNGNGNRNRRKPGRGPMVEGPCGDGSRKANLCTKDSQCCTGWCRTALENQDGKGRCRCIKKGKPCTAKQTCCTGTCTNGVCPGKGPKPACGAVGDVCTNDASCCSGLACAGGTCSACKPSGAACSGNGDCCGDLICGAGTCQTCAPVVCASGCQYETVAEAYQAAQAGDTIYIGPGEYITSIMIDKDITLEGCPGESGVKLIPDYSAGAVDSYFAVIYENVNDTTLYSVSVRNLTFEGQNTTDTYDFLLRSNTSSSIDWTIQGCTLKSASAALYAYAGSHVIEDSRIDGCSYGAYMEYNFDRQAPQTLLVRNTTVTGCDSYGIYFGGIPPVTATIEGCTFTDNAGTALYYYGDDPPAVSTISVTNCTFTGNGAQGPFGGNPSFFLYHGTGTMTGCTFSGNLEGMYVYDASLTIVDTQITGNNGRYGGGVYLNANSYDVSLTLEGTTAITGNTATVNGGGIYSNADGGTVTVTGAGTRVSGNSPDQCYSDEAAGVVDCGTWQV